MPAHGRHAMEPKGNESESMIDWSDEEDEDGCGEEEFEDAMASAVTTASALAFRFLLELLFG